MTKCKTIDNEPNWNKILETKKSVRNYLSRRVAELTNEIKDQPVTLEKSHVLHRINWVAQIIYHTLGTIVFLIGKLIAKMGKSKSLYHTCQIKFFNHGTKLYSRAKGLESPSALLVKSHNGFNLNKSKIPFRTDLIYNRESFDMAKIEGNCYGTCYLFNLLYLEGKKKFPDLSDRELLIKISHFMRDGALPEASIIQLIPEDNTRKHLSTFYPEVNELMHIRPEERQLERIDIMKSEAMKEGIEKLKMLKIGIPYQLTTRTSITGNLHATLVIRTGEEEFYWFDPCRGLTFFNGKEGIKKLLRLWEYGTQQKCEISDLDKCQTRIDQSTDDFIRRHNLNASQAELLKNVESQIKERKSWDQILNMQDIKDQQNLVRHYFETYREHVNYLREFQFAFGHIKGIFLTPMQHSIVGRRANKSQTVKCYYWEKNRENEPLECPVSETPNERF